MRITYLYNSGFAVCLNGCQLVFDYYIGKLPNVDMPTIFFASHSHPDHFNSHIFARRGEGVKFILSGEIDIPESPDTIKLNEGKHAVPLPGVKVTAFGSTDLGVSFMVEAENKIIFHAGDYNLWHWRSESTIEEIAEAEELFYMVLDTLMPYKDKIDIAFFPIDGRMGEGTEEGARIFTETLHPKILVPMHFGTNTSAPTGAAHTLGKLTRYVVLTDTGAAIDI